MASKKYTTYLDENLIKEIKKIAIDKETTVAQILNELIRDYIKKEKHEKNFYE